MPAYLDIVQSIAMVAGTVISIVAAYLASASANRAKQHMERETRSWDTQKLFYLHEFLSQRRYADARRNLRRALKQQAPYDPGTHDEDMDLVCASYDQAGFLLTNAKKKYINSEDRDALLLSSWGHSIIEQYHIVRHYELMRGPQHPSNIHSTQGFFKHFRKLYETTCDVRRYTKMEGW